MRFLFFGVLKSRASIDPVYWMGDFPEKVRWVSGVSGLKYGGKDRFSIYFKTQSNLHYDEPKTCIRRSVFELVFRRYFRAAPADPGASKKRTPRSRRSHQLQYASIQDFRSTDLLRCRKKAHRAISD